MGVCSGRGLDKLLCEVQKAFVLVGLSRSVSSTLAVYQGMASAVEEKRGFNGSLWVSPAQDLDVWLFPFLNEGLKCKTEACL